MRFSFTKFIPLAVDILATKEFATKEARAEKPLKIERWSP